MAAAVVRLGSLLGRRSRVLGLQGARACAMPHIASCSSTASQRLLQRVQQELKLEQAILTKLPTVSNFETSVAGSLATLRRTHNQEEVKVQLDANHAVEVSPDEDELDELDESDEEEGDQKYIENSIAPTFTVSVTKPSGDCLQFDCSFDQFGSYKEKGNAWESMRIDTVSVVPTGSSLAESVYSTDTENLSQDLFDALLEFLMERNIDEQFANEILTFYKAFEHNCYVTNFLEGLKKYCTQ